MPKHLLSIDDLSDCEINDILARGEALASGSTERRVAPGGLIGLIFGQTSLRTRVGFAAAAARLGWHYIDVPERRQDATSMVESWSDTLRTVSGYVDLVVVRPGAQLSRDMIRDSVPIPYVNGGGVGHDAEHPSQALIDLFAMEHALGSVSALTVAVCGDLRMRTARSLLRLLARRAPRRLVLITAMELDDSAPPHLEGIAEYRQQWEIDDVDVLYVVGIPHGAVSHRVRDNMRVTGKTMAALPARSIVLSPLPVIDEIDDEARRDPRVRMFEQSDLGLHVRVALLEEVCH